MFRRNFFQGLFITALVFSIGLLLITCKPNNKNIDISQISVNLVADRLENDMVEHSDNLAFLENKYGSIFNLFTNQLVRIGSADTDSLKNNLNSFIRDSDIVEIYADTKKMYANFDDVNRQLTDAFRHYKYYFPNKIIPRVYTYIAAFNYAIAPSDSALGIGLDMYLGHDAKYYPVLNLPLYRTRKMSRSYIAVDAMKGWAQSDWELNPEQNDLLSQILYEGKMLYFLDLMMPDAPDSIKTGYTQQQIDWIRQNEKNVWGFFVDKNLLFETSPSQVAKYVNDGPATNGFPKESPGNIGQWIGYQIVKAYMNQNANVSLEQLMNDTDYKKIFRESKYKPKK